MCDTVDEIVGEDEYNEDEDLNVDGLIYDVGEVDDDTLKVDVRLVNGVIDDTMLRELIDVDELKIEREESGKQLESKVELMGQADGQLQGVQDDEPINEKKPAGQTVLLTDAKGQYEPAGQITGVPDIQKYDAGQGEHARERIRCPPSSLTITTPLSVTAIPCGNLNVAAVP